MAVGGSGGGVGDGVGDGPSVGGTVGVKVAVMIFTQGVAVGGGGVAVPHWYAAITVTSVASSKTIPMYRGRIRMVTFPFLNDIGFDDSGSSVVLDLGDHAHIISHKGEKG